MKKLVLDIEQLQVDSYATDSRTASERGTIGGHDSHTNTTRTYDFTCGGSACASPTNAVGCVPRPVSIVIVVNGADSPLYPEAGDVE